MARVFIDTNLWVYAYDTRDTYKQQQAQDFIAEVLAHEDCFVSLQVVNEFCNVMLKQGMDIELLIATLGGTLLPISQNPLDATIAERALRLWHKASLSYYDSLIIQAAIDLKCTKLYSEDLQHGQNFGKLQIINPFI
jgi:predicted nucleic acid-binding protein